MANLNFSAAQVKELYDNSNLNSKQIAERLSEITGEKVSIATLRQVVSMMGLDLRKRPRANGAQGRKKVEITISGLESFLAANPAQSESATPASGEPVRRFAGMDND